MKNLFVSYEIAVLLKEKDFNEPCICQYLIQDSTFEMSSPKVINLVPLVNSRAITVGILPKQVEFNICAPIYQQVLDWFREKHDLHIYPIRDGGYWIFRGADISDENNHSPEFNPEVLSHGGRKISDYYNQYENAIIEALKLI